MHKVEIITFKALNFRVKNPQYVIEHNLRRKAGEDMYKEISEEMFDDPNRIPIAQAVRAFFKLVQEVRETKQRKILTKNGRALVAISPLAEVALVESVQKNSKETANEKL